jgi:hypothetical protein
MNTMQNTRNTLPIIFDGKNGEKFPKAWKALANSPQGTNVKNEVIANYPIRLHRVFFIGLIRFSVFLGLWSSLLSQEILITLNSRQQTGKIVHFEQYQQMIHHVHIAIHEEENHSVRLAALETLADLVQNNAIKHVTRSLSNGVETI